jgi:hypothetical protein
MPAAFAFNATNNLARVRENTLNDVLRTFDVPATVEGIQGEHTLVLLVNPDAKKSAVRAALDDAVQRAPELQEFEEILFN